MRVQFPLPSRPTPRMPASAYRTFQVASPIATHYRPATCEEVDCPPHRFGWSTAVDETTELGQKQAHYIRKESGRSFVELDGGSTGLRLFEFSAGQRCFASDTHRAPVGRPELYVVREGDWRGNPRGIEPRVHANPADWVDEFANHQSKIIRAIEEG